MQPANLIRSLDAESQQLILLPTERCNFRCTYCYEDFKTGRMKPTVVSGIKALIAKRAPELRHLQLSWFGGEPLLAKDIVLDIMQYAIMLAKRHAFSISSSITTNAYLLTRKTFADLCSANVLRYQITLDGPQEVHDTMRVMANGASTFSKIFENIEHIHSTKELVQVVLRVHYSEKNREHLPALLERLSVICRKDSRFQVHLKSLERLGGPNSKRIEKWDPDRRVKIREELMRFLPDSSVIEFDDYMCYASRPNSFIIRANGTIAKCTVAFNSPKNYLGTINEEGDIDVDQEKIAYWIRGIFSGNQAELGCPANDRSIRITEIGADK